LWEGNKSNIEKITGITDKEEYRNNKEAQQKYQNWLTAENKKYIPTLKKEINLSKLKALNDESLLFLMHYLGNSDTKIYLKTLVNNIDNGIETAYDKAQEAVNNSIKQRVGKLPTNIPIKQYLNIFLNKLNAR